jgi:formate dehydrogenase iron-sulfur subunit
MPGIFGLCTAACLFGVIAVDPSLNIARKCTLCYDRISNGMDEKIMGGLNSFCLLVDRPEVYGLPNKPRFSSKIE